MFRLERTQLDALLSTLAGAGYRVIGPRARDGAIVFGELQSSADLPVGWTDRQAPGRYRLEQTGGDALFDYVVGPESPRKFLTPSVEALVQIRRPAKPGPSKEGARVEAAERDTRPIALLGVRACDLAAMTSHDRLWTGGPFVDPRYAGNLESSIINSRR